MKRLFIAALFTASGLTVSARASETRARTFALIVSIGKYASDDVDQLSGARQDLENIRKICELIGIPDQNRMELYNERATRANFLQAMDDLARKMNRDDRALIYFSGHGFQIADGQNKDEADGYDEAFGFYELQNNANQCSGYLLDEELNSLLGDLPSTKITLILDTCHSGTVAKSVRSGRQRGVAKRIDWEVEILHCDEDNRFDHPNFKDYVSFSACSDEEITYSTNQGSDLTRATLKILQEKGTGISNGQLMKEVRAYIEAHFPSRPGRPVLGGNRARYSEPFFLKNEPEPKQEPVALQPKPDASYGEGAVLGKPAGLEWLKRDRDYSMGLSSNRLYYRVGDPITLKLTAHKAGFLTVYSKDSTGEIYKLYPNPRHPLKWLEAGERLTLPEDDYKLEVSAPAGAQWIFVLQGDQPFDVVGKDIVGALNGSFRSWETDAFFRDCENWAKRQGRKGFGAAVLEIHVSD